MADNDACRSGVSREQIWTSVMDKPRNELRVERCECCKLQVKVLSVHQSLLAIRCLSDLPNCRPYDLTKERAMAVENDRRGQAPTLPFLHDRKI